MVDLHSQWPTAVTQRLGAIAILFGQIEYLFKLYVKGFLVNFDKGMIVTSRMQFNQLLELTTALLKKEIADDVLKGRYFALVNKVESVEKRRNELFHSAWGMSREGETVSLSFTRTRTNQQRDGQGLTKNKKVIVEADLDVLLQDLEAVKAEVRNLRFEIWPDLRRKRKSKKAKGGKRSVKS
ncbi:MAG: hypothetical protein AB7M05_01760 [Alphaproteobacteria bacterium]